MELTYATIVVLASMIFVLAGMVGYLYWQQTKILQHVQSLAIMISTQLAPQVTYVQQEVLEEEEEQPEKKEQEQEEDDRVSVKEEVEHVEGPPPKVEETKKEVDVDDLEGKTKKQLQEMLTGKGIPFGKNDAKPVLIQLLKATA